MANIERYFNNGLTALKAGQFSDAERLLKKVLKAERNHVPSLNLLVVALMSLGRFADAEPYIAKAVQLDGTSTASLCNYGLILKRLKKPEQALQQFSRAIAINPDLAETWNNRGTVFNDLKQHRSAVADFDRATQLNPGYAEAFANKGSTLSDLQEHQAAFAAFDQALAIAPQLAEAWLGRGILLYDLKRYDESLAALDKAGAINGGMPALHSARGNSLYALNRFHDAILAYDRSLILQPGQKAIEDERFFAKVQCCDWANYSQELERLTRSIRNGETSGRPFEFLALSDSPRDQLICATSWIRREVSHGHAAAGRAHLRDEGRVRIGYVSADFHHHATAYLLAGVFEKHDRTKFDTTAVSLGPNDHSELRKRVEASFDTFIDASALSDEAVAAEIKAAEIDILIDLKGYTGYARPGIFAFRPAPLQVSYLGYPGTLGADFMDYLIADRIVIPDDSLENYSEKIVFLPDSYQANDDKRAVSEKTFSRAEAGLPDEGFVFCCFNKNYKITPTAFDSWMRILARVEGSVLWLFEDSAIASFNLRKEAAARGIDPARLVFARLIGLPDHLARHRLADLFLDTFPYNAHTTASDALWAGLPVLTRAGASFASRVAASLLHAVDLPELITNSAEDFESLAIALANDRDRLAGMKDKLARNRSSKPLFDTARFTRHLELAYRAMYDRHRAGLRPDHLSITPTEVNFLDTEHRTSDERSMAARDDALLPRAVKGMNPHFLTKRCKHGTFIVNPNDTFVGRSLDRYGEWCEFEIGAIRRFLKPGDVVIDVGANIGSHTVAFARMVGAGHVFAFEAQPRLFDVLQANVQLNELPNVTATCVAIGDHIGEMPMGELPADDVSFNFGALPLRESTGAFGKTPVTTIDHLQCRPSLIKIDVEGMEAEVLRGARETIRKHLPTLYLENNGDDCQSVARTLREMGYRAWWSIGPYYNPWNHNGDKQNVWAPNLMPSINLIAVHQTSNISLPILPEFTGDNWRVTLQREPLVVGFDEIARASMFVKAAAQ